MVIGAHIDEHAVSLIAEEVPDDPFLPVFGVVCATKAVFEDFQLVAFPGKVWLPLEPRPGDPAVVGQNPNKSREQGQLDDVQLRAGNIHHDRDGLTWPRRKVHPTISSTKATTGPIAWKLVPSR